MDSHKIIYRETSIIAAGVTVCTAVMLGIYALVGRLRPGVLWGSLFGSVLSVGNFFFMSIATGLAADKAAAQDTKAGQLLMRNSYLLRLIALFGILFACAKSGVFDPFALALPFVFVRPTLTAAGFFRKKGENAK